MNFNLFDDLDDKVIYNRPFMQNFSDDVDLIENSNDVLSKFPDNTPLAMAYVPFQKWGEVYKSHDGFHEGTIFPELDFPFMRGADSDE